MRSIGLTLTALLLGTGPALATRSLSCDFKDGTLAFVAEAALSNLQGGNLTTFNGKLETKAKGVPDDLRNVAFTLEHLTQQWLRAGDLKLHLYRERAAADPHGFVDLVVETKRVTRGKAKDAPDEIRYRGSYVLTVHYLQSPTDTQGQTVTVRGNASCDLA